MIRFEDVIIEIGDFQLAANMTVPKGFTSVIGQSGAGKSTLLSALSGHRPLTSGKIFVDETRIDLLSPNKRPCSIHISGIQFIPSLVHSSKFKFSLW